MGGRVGWRRFAEGGRVTAWARGSGLGGIADLLWGVARTLCSWGRRWWKDHVVGGRKRSLKSDEVEMMWLIRFRFMGLVDLKSSWFWILDFWDFQV